MGWGLIKQDTGHALGIRLTTLRQQDGAAVGSETRPLPPAGLPRGGLHRRREPRRLLQRRDALEGLHAPAGHAAPAGAVEAQAACGVAEDPHRLGGRLPASGRHGPQAARAGLDNVRRRRPFCWAGLGLGRVSWAVSWECPRPWRVGEGTARAHASRRHGWMAPELAHPLRLARRAGRWAKTAAGRLLWPDGAPAAVDVNRAGSPPSREVRHQTATVCRCTARGAAACRRVVSCPDLRRTTKGKRGRHWASRSRRKRACRVSRSSVIAGMGGYIAFLR